MNSELLVFVHIEKCAGTSIISALRSMFGRHHFDLIPRNKNSMIASKKDISDIFRIDRKVKSIAGHSIRGFIDFEYKVDALCYAVVRDPVRRLISDYKYFRDVLGFDGSISSFLAKKDRSNFQVRALCGSDSHEAAIRVIENKISLLGVVEKFDCFIDGLSVLSGNDFSAYKGKKINAASNRKNNSTDSLSSEDMELIVNANIEDIKLYNYIIKNLLGEDGYYANDKLIKSELSLSKPSKLRLYENLIFRNLFYKPYMGYYPFITHALPVYRDVNK